MPKEITISLLEVIGSPLCVASRDGQKVYKRLAAALAEGCRVNLSFNHVTALTSAFLNAAVGQLYGKFDEQHIRSLLRVKEVEQSDLVLLKRVVDSAKKYFEDPAYFEQGLQDEMGDEDGG